MIGSGGTKGGIGQFIIGCLLAAVGGYLFFDSVRMTTGHYGMISGMFSGMGRGGMANFFDTTSMAIVFLPLAIGVFSLFVNAKQKWAWWLTWGGLGVLVVEMISRVHFAMNIKTSSFVLMLVTVCAGLAMIFKSYRDKGDSNEKES